MRTKHILISMALGAAFVSCSQEELIAPENGAVNDAKLGIRPVVDTQITLGNNADTRLVLGGAFRPTWSTNDKIGAAIIDVPTYTHAGTGAGGYVTALGAAAHGAVDLYTINEWYGCNNAFSTTDGGTTWAAEHPMVEGNYLFYAPYSETMDVRTPLVVAVPRQQDASSAKSALSEFYTSGQVVEVGYKFITGSDKKNPTGIKMFNIFAYPKFTIKNNFDGYLFNSTGAGDAATSAYSGDIKIDSIQFVNVNNTQTALATLQIGGQLKHAAANTETGYTASAGVVGNMKSAGAWNDVDALLATAKTTDLLNTASNKIMVGRHNMTGVITTLVVGQTIAKGGSIDVYCVMPAAKFDFNTNQLLAKIYATINGVGYEIYQATFAATGANTWGVSDVKLSAAANNPGYLFGANGNNGLSSLSFMAGQAYPSEALRVDANGNYQKKTGVNNLLEINLVGGKAEKANTPNVQIAVRMGATNSGYATTEALIEAIENAANGTNWVEGATSNANQKGFVIAASNTVEINSALIDALAKNNQNGGGFKLSTSVLPVANDVTLVGVNVGTKTATFKSAGGNEAAIEFAAAIVETTAADASNKYAIENGNVFTGFNNKTVVLVPAGQTFTLSADQTVRSLVVAPGIAGGAAAGIVNIAGNKLTADNVNNKGTMTVKDLTALDVVNDGDMTVNGTIAAPTGKSLTFTNNGTVTTGTAAASFVVTAGEGTIVLPQASASSSALVGAGAVQEVIYDATTTVATAQINAAAAIPNVTAIRANGAITLVKSDIAKFGAIRKIYANTSVATNELETLDLTGFTLVLTMNATWTGANVNQTIIKGLTVDVAKKYTLTLTTVAFTDATLRNAVKNTGIVANGVTAKWNGGASAKLQ